MKRELGILLPEIERRIKEAQGIEIEVGFNSGRLVMTNGFVSMVLAWRNTGTPGIEEDALRRFDFDVRIALPGGPPLMSPGLWNSMMPEATRTIDYQLDPDIACQPIWNSREAQEMTTARLAEQLVIEFLDLAQRRAQRPRKPPRMNLIG
jgi:hypothetical protein